MANPVPTSTRPGPATRMSHTTAGIARQGKSARGARLMGAVVISSCFRWIRAGGKSRIICSPNRNDRHMKENSLILPNCSLLFIFDNPSGKSALTPRAFKKSCNASIHFASEWIPTGRVQLDGAGGDGIAIRLAGNVEYIERY